MNNQSLRFMFILFQFQEKIFKNEEMKQEVAKQIDEQIKKYATSRHIIRLTLLFYLMN